MRDVPIPGGSARFKTKEELRGRDSKRIKASVMAASNLLTIMGDAATVKPGETREQAAERLAEYLKEHPLNITEEDAMKLMSLRETIALAYLVSWTLDMPLPKTNDELGDLPDPLYEAIIEAVGGDFLDATTSVDTDVNPDKSSPTGPSSSSDGDLRAEESDLTPSSIPSS